MLPNTINYYKQREINIVMNHKSFQSLQPYEKTTVINLNVTKHGRVLTLSTSQTEMWSSESLVMIWRLSFSTWYCLMLAPPATNVLTVNSKKGQKFVLFHLDFILVRSKITDMEMDIRIQSIESVSNFLPTSTVDSLRIKSVTL